MVSKRVTCCVENSERNAGIADFSATLARAPVQKTDRTWFKQDERGPRLVVNRELDHMLTAGLGDATKLLLHELCEGHDNELEHGD